MLAQIDNLILRSGVTKASFDSGNFILLYYNSMIRKYFFIFSGNKRASVDQCSGAGDGADLGGRRCWHQERRPHRLGGLVGLRCHAVRGPVDGDERAVLQLQGVRRPAHRADAQAFVFRARTAEADDADRHRALSPPRPAASSSPPRSSAPRTSAGRRCRRAGRLRRGSAAAGRCAPCR